MAIETAASTLLAGRYRVIERLGSGAMAAVYLAHDERLDRRVAVKRLHTAGGDAMDGRRFEREAKLGASLSHPNLVSIFDAEQDDESVLLVMEYVQGETLADLLARGPVEPQRAVRIVRELAAALDHAHAAGIVHRDVKPANVLLSSRGPVKLADLGIAKAVSHTAITGTGTVLGTPAYMAPEQLEGGHLGPAVDVYALAAVAFEMLTGRKAREGRTAVEIAHRVATEPPPDAREADPALPVAAADAIRRGMAREPDERPASTGAFADELERAFRRVADAGPTPQPATTERVAPSRIRERPPQAPPADERPYVSRRRPLPAWVIAMAGLFALAAVVIALVSAGGEDRDGSRAGKDRAAERRGEGSAPAGGDASEGAPAQPAANPVEGVPQPAGAGTVEQARDLQLQGYNALQAGDYETAVELSRRAVEAFPPGTTDPQYAYALFNLGRALRLGGDPAAAIPVLEARLEIPNQTATVERELEAARAAAGG